MANVTLPTTRITLLTQLRHDPSDQAGWDELVERYGRHIHRWCRQWKLQDADAEDVTQDILVKLTQKLCSSRTTRRAVSAAGSRRSLTMLEDFEDSRRHAQRAAGGSQVQELMLTLEAREDLAAVGGGFRSGTPGSGQAAGERLRVAPHTWEAFRLLALEGLPVTEVAARVRLQVAMVYVAKSKVQKMLQEEIGKLEMAV